MACQNAPAPGASAAKSCKALRRTSRHLTRSWQAEWQAAAGATSRSRDRLAAPEKTLDVDAPLRTAVHGKAASRTKPSPHQQGSQQDELGPDPCVNNNAASSTQRRINPATNTAGRGWQRRPLPATITEDPPRSSCVTPCCPATPCCLLPAAAVNEQCASSLLCLQVHVFPAS